MVEVEQAGARLKINMWLQFVKKPSCEQELRQVRF